ncbi:MAG: hypothetical protein OXF50_06520 [Caldilineaceae bacterium]|nr:hypothetical protein [Caldilineaceae bacterium]
MSQEQDNLTELIYALNETMVGKLDALNDRIDKLESTLTDDALAISGEQESLIIGLQKLLQDADKNLGVSAPPDPNDDTPPRKVLVPENWPIFHVYSMVWAIATHLNLDPQFHTDSVMEFLQDPTGFFAKHSPPAS